MVSGTRGLLEQLRLDFSKGAVVPKVARSENPRINSHLFSGSNLFFSAVSDAVFDVTE